VNNEHCRECGISYDSDYQSCNCKDRPQRRTMDAKCWICGVTTNTPIYDDWVCSACGQAYEYNESHQIVLTEQQLDLLRTLLPIAIPPGVYYSAANDNFYTVQSHQGMGAAFYTTWRDRWAEFPARDVAWR
jgi:hypothetical protein